MSVVIERLVHARRHGQAVAETALVMIVLIPILLGGVDLARAYFDFVELTHAVNEGARFAHSDAAITPARVEAATRNRAGVLTLTTVVVTCAAISADGISATAKACTRPPLVRGDRIDVTATATFRPLTPFVEDVVGGTTWTLSATTRRSYQ